MNISKRETKFDIVRVFAMTLVIAVHSNPKPFSATSLSGIIFYTTLYICNGLFYMLSGSLNLSKEFTKKEEYISFYKNKSITILLPFILGSILYSIYNYEGEFRVIWMVKTIIKGFFTDNAGTHLWFMYPLIGMILSTPFLSKALHTMNDWEIKLLFFIGVLWQIFSIYFSVDLGTAFSFSSWILSSWMFHYFLGYFVSRIVTSENKKKFYICAIAGFFMTITLKYLLPDSYQYSYDLAIAHVLFTLGVYIYLTHEITICNPILKKTFLVISSHSFTIYILHNIVKKELSKAFQGISTPIVEYLLNFTLTLFITFIIAVIVDNLFLHPVQRFLKNK